MAGGCSRCPVTLYEGMREVGADESEVGARSPAVVSV